MPIRGPTEHEKREVLPLAARGWESQTKEFDFWFTPDQIEGTCPQEIHGTFLRNGPGVTEVFGTPLKHPIDGDGMVCAVTFIDGKVHFRSRYVQTETHKKEVQAGKMLFPGQMGSRPPKETAQKKWRDPSHTNVFYWGGKILTCHEYTLPHTLDPTTLETIGRDTLGGTLDLGALSAHFRYDPREDLLVVVAFKPGIAKQKPRTCLYEYDRKWNLVRKAKVSVPGLNYAHDFLLSPDWYVLHMTPFVDTSPDLAMKILRGETSPGESMRYVPNAPSKMVFVKRSSPDVIISIDTEPCHIYHFGTCYQSSPTSLTFNACCLPPGFTMEWQYKTFLSNTADAPGVMHQYTAELGGTPSLTRKVIPEVANVSCEFPFTNPYRHCVRDEVEAPRYFYLMAGQEGIALPFCDVVKHDLKGERCERWHSEGVVGEPAFIPRHGRASATFGDEDDGWLIVQLYIPKQHRTEFVILDATRVADGPVCRLKVPHHIPISFHGTFTENVFVRPRPRL